MAKSACWSYVTWYHKLSGNWATWEPGEFLAAGDVGRFDSDRRFHHSENLADYHITFSVSAERPATPRLYVTGDDFRVEARAAEKLAPGLSALGHAGAGLRIVARKEHACVLQLQGVTESHILAKRDVLVQIAKLLSQRRWAIDSAVVVGRLRVSRGLAAISLGAGQSMELNVSGEVRLAQGLEIGHAELVLAHRRSTTGFLLYEFEADETPVFLPPIRIKRSLWARLLPWRTDGRWIIDPDGRRHDPQRLVSASSLSGFDTEARRYDPEKSGMTLTELSELTVEDLFEEVSSLADEDEQEVSLSASPSGKANTASAAPGVRLLARSTPFQLPLPRVTSALAAAGPADDAPPLLDTLSNDDLVRFVLHQRGPAEYRLEVSLEARAGPLAVVALRYGTVAGSQRDLLIPVDGGRSDLPNSVVELEDYASRAAWQAWPPAPPESVQAWGDEVIEASIYAAATVATVEAWERLAADLPDTTRILIIRVVDSLRSMP